MDDAPRTAIPDLHHEGDHGEEHGDVEYQVCDGYPVLKTTPIIKDDHIEVFTTGTDCDDHPAYQQAVVSFQSSKNQHKAANDSEKGVENGILDNWTKAHILIIALIVVFLIEESDTFCIFNNVENCDDCCDDKFNDANDNN